MFRTGRRWLFGLTVCLVLALPAPSRAGWIGLRNDTRAVLVIQRATVVNNVPCPGRPLVLYPGEVAWDSVVQPCAKLIAVYEPQQPQQPMLEGRLTCGGDEFYSLQSAGPGKVKLTRATPPALPAKGQPPPGVRAAARNSSR